METKTDRKYVSRITLLGIMVYFSSYITRINYAAIISEFITAESVTKTSAAIVTTAAFITYGLGQIVSGILGDKFDPRKLIFLGSAVTVSMNIAISFAAPNIPLMTAIWALNGFSQAFMWPPLVKILMFCLSPEDYDRSIVKIAYGSSGGTIAVYLFSPFIIRYLGYRNVFRFSAGFSLVFTVIWLIASSGATAGADFTVKKAKAVKEETGSQPSKYIFALLPFIILSIIIQGMLRDGISTWFPNYISEVFNIPNTKSILIAVVLPVFHLVCSLLTYNVLKAMHNNVFACLTFFFGVIMTFVIILKLCGGSLIMLSVFMFAMVNGLAHSINILQTEYMPKYFAFTGKISTYTGLLNACTYIGSAVSTYAFAYISKNFGWDTTLTSWVIFAMSGALIALLCLTVSKKRSENKN